jgi:hypothetical protein
VSGLARSDEWDGGRYNLTGETAPPPIFSLFGANNFPVRAKNVPVPANKIPCYFAHGRPHAGGCAFGNIMKNKRFLTA